jgi:hypothetical protein
MLLRGGGVPTPSMALMPPEEWACRLGTSPYEANDCFMVRIVIDPTEYKVAARGIAPLAGSPRHSTISVRRNQELDNRNPIQANDCFMVRIVIDPTEYKVAARGIAPLAGSPRHSTISVRRNQELDNRNPIQGWGGRIFRLRGERGPRASLPCPKHGPVNIGAGNGDGFVNGEARPPAKAVQARKWKPRPQRSGAGPKPRRLQERRKCAEGLWAALVGGNV